MNSLLNTKNFAKGILGESINVENNIFEITSPNLTLGSLQNKLIKTFVQAQSKDD